MATATRVSVPLEEYLETSYRPDRDWIDGKLKERNVGEGSHAVVQLFFLGFFLEHRAEWGIRVVPEQRVQTSATHFRVPDVSVLQASAPFEEIVRIPPLLCIEVLSWDDRMSEVQERVEDYLAMGVETVWLVDPRHRKGFVADRQGQQEVEELSVPGTGMRVTLSDVFAELDELEAKR